MDCSLELVISYCESTKDEDWLTGVCRSKDQKQNCLLGHVFNMGKDEKEGNEWVDWFEGCIATTYMFSPVNDGEHPKYKQETPRLRCLAYLKDLERGAEDTVYELLKRHTKATP